VDIEQLRNAIVGEVIVPGDPGYDEARRVWNGIIDRRPAVIARCAGLADVVEVVRFAREHPIEVSIRGGGHQIAGSAVCDEGLVIDLSTMNGVFVDPVARTARVQAGARWRDVDRATQCFGLATTGGEVSETGVAGLTLGGGMGLTQRAFGLACDGLRSIEIVTADGVVRTASPHEHPELFWAARGGGRGLGVVTAFEFGLHPLGPDVALHQTAFDYADAPAGMRAWRDAALAAPETISPELMLLPIPPDPEIPEEVHGQHVFMTAELFAGDPADARPAFAPFTTLGREVVDLSGTMPYVAIQSSFDPLAPAGGRYYFKSHMLDELSDAAIDELLACDRERPAVGSGFILVVIRTLGGAIDRVSADESAFAHRGARFNLSFDAMWEDPADDAAMIGWCRATWERMQKYANGGVYVNFAGFDDEADIASTMGAHATRLAEVRGRYDPAGLFDGAARRP